MNWINIETKKPPKKSKSYQILALCVDIYKGGNYNGQQKITIVQDWVFRQNEKKFTHWVEIKFPISNLK